MILTTEEKEYIQKFFPNATYIAWNKAGKAFVFDNTPVYDKLVDTWFKEEFKNTRGIPVPGLNDLNPDGAEFLLEFGDVVNINQLLSPEELSALRVLVPNMNWLTWDAPYETEPLGVCCAFHKKPVYDAYCKVWTRASNDPVDMINMEALAHKTDQPVCIYIGADVTI